MPRSKEYGKVKGPYIQKSVRGRIEALFLDNVGKVITRDHLIQVATDPTTKIIPENWHQRLSELRTDSGYTIQSSRDRPDLKVSEYVLVSTEKRADAKGRVKPTAIAWQAVLRRAGGGCEWEEAGVRCRLKDGDLDPVGGGTVRLTPDHKTPHSIDPATDPESPGAWQALCGRHQVVKKNYWDHGTGWLNVRAIIQAASKNEKLTVFRFLSEYFDQVRSEPELDPTTLLARVQETSESEKRIVFEFLKVYFARK